MKLRLSFSLALMAVLSSAHKLTIKKVKTAQPFHRRSAGSDFQITVDAEPGSANTFDLE